MKRVFTATRTWKTCTSSSVLLFASAAAVFAADSAPIPPCGAAPFPAYPAPDAPPAVKVWNHAEWTPPPCISWPPFPGATVVAAAARFRYPSGVEGLRRRIGAVSALKGLVYWSTTHQQWRPLILDATALENGARRKDFALDEVVPGRDLFFQQQDNLFGTAEYRIRVLEAMPRRLVFATENTEGLRYLGLTIAQPGEIQTVVFLDTESKDIWRYYALARTGKAAGLFTAGHEASLINRAVASFRHLAGIPPDQEPPAAR